MNGNISIVIGSWGSYNECNERALGSKWLDLSDYSDWEEIASELKKEGFELDGIDEELFIQDVEGISDNSVNWDYVNPETLFNTLNESGILTNDYKYKVFCAFLEVRCFDDFEERVKSHGERWDDDIILWENRDWYYGFEEIRTNDTFVYALCKVNSVKQAIIISLVDGAIMPAEVPETLDGY